jgi:lysine-specific demethylase 8
MTNWKAMEWTVPQLKDRFSKAKMPVQMDDDEFGAFCEATSDLFLRDSKEARRLAIKELSFWVIRLDAYFDAVLRGGDLARRLPYLMDVPLSRSILQPYLRVLKIDSAEDWDPLISALESLIADVAFPEYIVGNRDYRLWFTPRPRRRGTIHADGYHNLNAQIRGRKQWILLSPEQRGRLYRADIKPKMPDSAGIGSDTARHPELAAEGFSCTTNEGELLYIPKLWWHAATAMGTCININAWHVLPP